MRFVGCLLLGLFIAGSPSAEAAVRSYTTAELCAVADRVVIAVVQQRTPMWLDSAQTTVVTKVTLTVERTVVGEASAAVSVTTLGGTIGTVVQVVGDEPVMDLGSRYLLLLSDPGTSSPALIGGRVGARRLDSMAPLPTNEALQAEWREVCEEGLSAPGPTSGSVDAGGWLRRRLGW